jgi:hypothetical protein
MNLRNTNTTKPTCNRPPGLLIRRKRGLLAIVSLLLLPGIAAAHGGEEHVTGVVTKVSDTSITVKTTAGKLVDVGLDAKTTYARAKQAIQKTDIKPGDRIVIHAVEVKEKLTAHTVEIGIATTAAKQTVKH